MKLSAKEMSAFLMYRMIHPDSINTIPKVFPNRIPINNSFELESYLSKRIGKVSKDKTALALSGGIDSAILAKFMPRGSVAYTFKCVVPGVKVTDEVPAAAGGTCRGPVLRRRLPGTLQLPRESREPGP